MALTYEMGQRELETLRSLSPRIPDEFLLEYVAWLAKKFPRGDPTGKRLHDMGRRKKKLDREFIYRTVAFETVPYRAHILFDLILQLNLKLGIKPQFIEHGTYISFPTTGRAVTAKEIVETYTSAEEKSSGSGAAKVQDLLSRSKGGELCDAMSRLEGEEILGVGWVGTVFAINDKVHKLFSRRNRDKYGIRGGNPMQEIVVSSFVTVFAEEERNPHFVSLEHVDVCPRVYGNETIDFSILTMRRIAGTIAQSSSLPDSKALHSLMFQHLRCCLFLANHGIVHFDLHRDNLGYNVTTIDHIDYEDGWSVPTYGYVAKILDFGRADRYTFPTYRTHFTDVPYDTFNIANDPLTIVNSYREILEAHPEHQSEVMLNAVDKAIKFCEDEFGHKFERMIRHGEFGYLAEVSTDDITFLPRLLEFVFPEFKA